LCIQNLNKTNELSKTLNEIVELNIDTYLILNSLKQKIKMFTGFYTKLIDSKINNIRKYEGLYFNLHIKIGMSIISLFLYIITIKNYLLGS